MFRFYSYDVSVGIGIVAVLLGLLLSRYSFICDYNYIILSIYYCVFIIIICLYIYLLHVYYYMVTQD